MHQGEDANHHIVTLDRQNERLRIGLAGDRSGSVAHASHGDPRPRCKLKPVRQGEWSRGGTVTALGEQRETQGLAIHASFNLVEQCVLGAEESDRVVEECREGAEPVG